MKTAFYFWNILNYKKLFKNQELKSTKFTLKSNMGPYTRLPLNPITELLFLDMLENIWLLWGFFKLVLNIYRYTFSTKLKNSPIDYKLNVCYKHNSENV